MKDQLMPDWIKQIKAERDREGESTKSAIREHLVVDKILQADGPGFWKLLCKDLHVAAGALSAIGIGASVSDIGGVGSECGLQIQLTIESAMVRNTHTNMFYRPGSDCVSYHTMEGEAGSWKLSVCDSAITIDAGAGAGDSEQAAKWILYPMLKKIGVRMAGF